jgi:cyclophilin family peptidyl-prolyl cis-trans isomerase
MLLTIVLSLLLVPAAPDAGQTPASKTSPGAGPVVVLETAKGTIEFETYPEEAPKTVAHILNLVRRGFYTGMRFHRVESNFVIQIGDPASRDMTQQEVWGRSGRGSGKPIGAAEITKKRRHAGPGTVGMAHAGAAAAADSQFYITLRAAPELDSGYAVFGRVIAGMDVVRRIERADLLRRAYVRGEGPK